MTPIIKRADPIPLAGIGKNKKGVGHGVVIFTDTIQRTSNDATVEKLFQQFVSKAKMALPKNFEDSTLRFIGLITMDCTVKMMCPLDGTKLPETFLQEMLQQRNASDICLAFFSIREADIIYPK